jgi:putative ABC transport system permease protein
MVVSEVAMAVILMTGAGLLARSLLNLMRVSPGFSSRDVMTLYVSLPPAQYPQADRRLAFYRRLLDRVRGLPGVESAAAVSHMPLGNTPRFFFFCPETTVCKGLGKDPISAWRQVSPDYFGAMRTPLLDGRVFDDRDGPDSPPVAIINKTIADRYFSGLHPIGRHIAGSREKIPMEIVGVVADTKVIALSDAPVEEVYLPYTQNTWSSMTLLVRSGPGLPAPVAAIGQVLRQMDPGLPLASVQSLDEVVSGSIAQPALIADLAGAFALSALLLAAVGIYGVLAHLVTERSKEIAIRMAMGAGRGTIFRLMVSHGMRLVGFGLALGLAASPAVARLLSALLAGTGPADFATMAGAAATFAIVGFCACCFPSRRAMRLDALTVLR